jgi:3'(2'), 5'-bisphosphate nucleotidase
MSFDPQRPGELLPQVIDIARAAGVEIMRVYRQEFAVTMKDDRSPLTEADLASQRLITARLAALTPDIPLLGEESAGADIALRRDWRTLWLVDPLDGTREFVKRNGEFTVNIALVHDHVAVLGVLYAPALNLLYAAARGHGAIRIDADGTRHALRAAIPAPGTPRILGSRSHRGASLDRLLSRLPSHELLAIGSALKFGWLADGRGDFYARVGPTSEWDTAAGQVIAEEAGARVTDLQGKPLRYNARDTLINPSFAAWADDSRNWLQLLQP